MLDPRISQLADLLVRHSVRVQPGDRVFLEAFDIPPEVTACVVRALAEAGAVPVVETRQNRVLRELYRHATDEQMRLIGEFELARMKAMDGYIVKDAKSGMMKVARLPAKDDPYTARIDRIRERDGAVVDTVNGYYANFSDTMRDSYGSWRRSSFDEIEKESRARNQARTRTLLGAAAVLAAVFVPGQCNAYDYNCRRIENAARTAGATCLRAAAT